MTNFTGIALVSVVAALSIAAAVEVKSRDNVVTAGFWFEEGMTFEVPYPRRLGGPLTDVEQQRIMTVARAEVAQAFTPFRVHLVDSRMASYRVGVTQVIRPRAGSPVRYSGAAGQSMTFGAFGGSGIVNFFLLAAQAMTLAPAGATRAEIVDGIGRGVGRAAVHEFAHQILPREPLHSSRDESSYEYGTSNRVGQYYGPARWSVAQPALIARLGR